MLRFFITSILFNLIFSQLNNCIPDRDSREIVRDQFTFPETIQSENFVIHFTTSNVDSQFVNGQWFSLQSNFGYAQSISDHLENALVEYQNQGWVDIPPDCDESIVDINSPEHCINYGGNSLYDVYISNDAVGMVVPENPYPVPPYTGGYTSFMKISTLLNQHEILPSWNYHVIAHELHHSIQLRYGYSVSGEPGNYMYNGWFFEQSATYMENVIYPESFHLRIMLSNCDVVTPLTYPEYNIDYPSEIYPYRSALWQKFLVESYADSSIVKNLWENYGIQYSSGDIVSMFPIYDNAIQQSTQQNYNLSDAYRQYAIWRYFTGERSIPNMYFNESSSYCTSNATTDFIGEFFLPSNKGACKLLEIPSSTSELNIYSDQSEYLSFSHLIINNDNSVQQTLIEPENNIYHFEPNEDAINVLIANSNFLDIDNFDLQFEISNNLIGDLNSDLVINVIDAVILVELILNSNYEFYADINMDNFLDILDLVQLINLILE
tara:strand:+ start:842 stop:2320 length:1479 start_codon:yes stop_codon:yes gene_type:complete